RWKRFSSEPLEVGEPDLDERADRVFEPCFAGGLERLLIALPGLGRIDALLQPVVSGDEELLDSFVRLAPLHKSTVTGHCCWTEMHAAANGSDRIRVLIADDHR